MTEKPDHAWSGFLFLFAARAHNPNQLQTASPNKRLGESVKIPAITNAPKYMLTIVMLCPLILRLRAM